MDGSLCDYNIHRNNFGSTRTARLYVNNSVGPVDHARNAEKIMLFLDSEIPAGTLSILKKKMRRHVTYQELLKKNKNPAGFARLSKAAGK